VASLSGLADWAGCARCANPSVGIEAGGDGGVEGGVGSVRGGFCQAVFDRVEVDIVHVRRVIGLVADGVFPDAPLPDAALAF